MHKVLEEVLLIRLPGLYIVVQTVIKLIKKIVFSLIFLMGSGKLGTSQVAQW